jgi:hypothetical protein
MNTFNVEEFDENKWHRDLHMDTCERIVNSENWANPKNYKCDIVSIVDQCHNLDYEHYDDHYDHEHNEDHEDHEHHEDHDDHEHHEDHDDHEHHEDHDDHEDHEDHEDHDDHEHHEDHDDHEHHEDHDDWRNEQDVLNEDDDCYHYVMTGNKIVKVIALNAYDSNYDDDLDDNLDDILDDDSNYLDCLDCLDCLDREDGYDTEEEIKKSRRHAKNIKFKICVDESYGYVLK